MRLPPRHELVALINSHLDMGIPDVNKHHHHYGRMELKVLLDLLYGGPPNKLKIEDHLLAK